MAGKKILIVDDNQIILKTLSMKLAGGDFEVLTAADGSDAVRTAREKKPDLIILDIGFPPDVAHGGGVPWDGFLIIQWLRRMDEARDTPIIIITQSDSAEYKARALEAGACAFFNKPINHDELLACIRQTLGIDAAVHPAP